jgi:activator of HSP90 ATPase
LIHVKEQAKDTGNDQKTTKQIVEKTKNVERREHGNIDVLRTRYDKSCAEAAQVKGKIEIKDCRNTETPKSKNKRSTTYERCNCGTSSRTLLSRGYIYYEKTYQRTKQFYAR